MFQSDTLIKQATIEELELILRNENLCYQFPWSKQMLSDCLVNQYLLNQHHSLDIAEFNPLDSEGKYVVFVMFYDEKIVGHLIIQKVLDEFHLHNVCVLPSYQGKKLGQKWMSYLKESMATFQVTKIILEVRESNLAAIHLYRNNGFQSIGIRKKYYQRSSNSRPENAIVFKWIDCKAL